jgi:hypothetical protein
MLCGSNAGRGEIFSTSLDRPWGQLSLPYNRYDVSFPGAKRPGRGFNHPLPSISEVKETVKLNLYSPVDLHGNLWQLLLEGYPKVPKTESSYKIQGAYKLLEDFVTP